MVCRVRLRSGQWISAFVNKSHCVVQSARLYHSDAMVIFFIRSVRAMYGYDDQIRDDKKDH